MPLDDIDPKRIPAHIACVMDGNGRWAQQRGLPRTEGHRAGEDALFDTVDGALELGVQWFTVYAFSTENWKRPQDEVRFLMYFSESILSRRRDELHERGVRIRFIGRRGWRMPKSVTRQMDEAIDEEFAGKAPARQRIGNKAPRWDAEQRPDGRDPEAKPDRVPFVG